MDAEGPLPIERQLRAHLETLGPATRTELIRVLTMSRKNRADRIGALFDDPKLKPLAELLMDIEDDPAAQARVVTVLRLMDRDLDRRGNDGDAL